MKTKETLRRPAKSRIQETIFSDMKQSDMTAIDRKIHDLLIAEGYRATGTQRLEGMKLNNFTNINRMEYRRGERERIILTTHEPKEKTNSIAGILWEPVAPDELNKIAHSA